MSFHKTITVEVDGVEYEEEWDLDLHFTPGEKAVMYYPNGDGYPGSPPEVELESAELIERTLDGKKVECDGMVLDGSEWDERAGIRTDKDREEFDEWAFGKCEDERDAAYEDACDHEMDEARDEGRRPRHISKGRGF
jgi:hypothetical protein